METWTVAGFGLAGSGERSHVMRWWVCPSFLGEEEETIGRAGFRRPSDEKRFCGPCGGEGKGGANPDRQYSSTDNLFCMRDLQFNKAVCAPKTASLQKKITPIKKTNILELFKGDAPTKIW